MTSRIEQVNDSWYYWVDKWTAAKGPFLSYEKAAEMLVKELETADGSNEIPEA